jgi:hypothetical protein
MEPDTASFLGGEERGVFQSALSSSISQNSTVNLGKSFGKCSERGSVGDKLYFNLPRSSGGSKSGGLLKLSRVPFQVILNLRSLRDWIRRV